MGTPLPRETTHLIFDPPNARPPAPAPRRGGNLLRRALSISGALADTSRRKGIPTTPDKQRQLEVAPAFFMKGYQTALQVRRLHDLGERLDRLPLANRGFAYEGAGMALALIDALSFGKSSAVCTFANGPAERHIYLVYVGAGWAFAKIPWARRQLWPRLDPLYKWLALDGLGFQRGFSRPERYLFAPHRPRSSDGDACGPVDQGLGRALWFVAGAQPLDCAEIIARHEPSRRSDLWSGLGLASAYAGASSDSDIRQLSTCAGSYRADLAQGIAFAAKARLRAENLVGHTSRACEIVWGMPAGQVAAVTDRALPTAQADIDGEAYEGWRARIREAFRNR